LSSLGRGYAGPPKDTPETTASGLANIAKNHCFPKNCQLFGTIFNAKRLPFFEMSISSVGKTIYIKLILKV